MLRCISTYRGTVDPDSDQQGVYAPGDEVHVAGPIAEFLLRASPGCFVRDGEPLPEGGELVDPLAGAPDRRQRGGRRR